MRTNRKITRQESFFLWCRYQLGERRCDLAREAPVSVERLRQIFAQIDRTVKYGNAKRLENWILTQWKSGSGWTIENPDGSLTHSEKKPEQRRPRILKDCNMGKKQGPKVEEVQVYLTVPKHLVEALDLHIDKIRYRNRSQLVRVILSEWLELKAWDKIAQDDPGKKTG